MSAPDHRVDPATMRPDAQIWGPLFVGITALICAFPAGLALAVIDWQRLGLLTKARRHLIGALIGAYAFAVLFVLTFPLGIAQYLYPAVNIGAFFYLRRELDRDLDTYAHAGYEPRRASGAVGVLIGVVLLVTLFVVIGATAIVLATLGIGRAA